MHSNMESFFAITNAAFNPDAILVNSQGSFTAINKTSGAVLWNTTKVVPFYHKNSAGQDVFPLGHHTLFVPNLQGYIVLDTKNGGSVMAINERSPMTATFSFMDSSSGKPFVVYGDLMTGSLVAVERS